MTHKNTQNIVKLLSLASNIKIAHWRANSKTNEHEALGDLYDSINPLIDTFAEVTLGINGSREIEVLNIVMSKDDDYKNLLNTGMDLVKEIEGDFTDCPDVLNNLADIRAALNHAKYFLML